VVGDGVFVDRERRQQHQQAHQLHDRAEGTRVEGAAGVQRHPGDRELEAVGGPVRVDRPRVQRGLQRDGQHGVDPGPELGVVHGAGHGPTLPAQPRWVPNQASSLR
jgi:hypothetical protein